MASIWVFEADSPGLSTFAISGEPVKVNIIDISIETEPARVGDQLKASVMIENEGGTNTSFDATLALDDRQVDSETVVVPARSTVDISLNHVVTQPGTFTLAINGSTIRTIEVLPESTAAPETTTESRLEPTPESIITTTPSITAGSTRTEVWNPGFGLGTAILALLLTAGFRLHRRIP